MARPTNDRIVGVLLISLVFLSLVWVRCVWLQVLGAKRYAAYAQAQQHNAERLQAQRGTIYDRNGRPLAVSVASPSVFADARHVMEKHDTAAQLSKVTGASTHAIQQRLEKDKRFVWVARQMDFSLTPAILAMRQQGIGIVEEPKRLYPQGPLAAHLMGFTNIDAQGLEGLEMTFNGMLKGQDGWRATLRDAKGDLLIGPWTSETEPVDGYDLVLTIDAVVQQVAEETLAWGVKKYHAKGGSVVVLDPHTGEVLAMANAPAYDPRNPAEGPMDARRNRAVTDLFEPGSTFKIVTASALLEEGRVTPEEMFFCEHGNWHTVAHHVLHDHTPHGMMPFRDVVKYSSNIGTAKAAQRLQPDELYRYIRAFGFGQKTGIDLPGEVSGLLHPPARWSKLSPYIIPIGQEVAGTPLQLAVMASVIASGGLRITPYVVDRMQTSNGRLVRPHVRREPTRVLSRETAELMQDFLSGVVESGTGQLANVQGLTVAGKTGTAQKLEPTGRYSHSRFVASFVGFGPVPDPRFVIVVSVDEPRPLYFGGVVAAPMFKRMVDQLSAYWELERLPAAPRLAGATRMQVAKQP